MNGPGKYDDLCTYVRTMAKAEGAIIIVIDGSKGSGFSVQVPIEHLIKLPDTLEFMAEQIRQDIAAAQTSP